MILTGQAVVQFLQSWWVELVCAVVLVGVVLLIAGFLVLVEHKFPADTQFPPGSRSVASRALLQSIVDGLKCLLTEDNFPRNFDSLIFRSAPVISMVTALASMAALYFGPAFRVARDINIGILFVIGVSALGFLGIILDGWTSNNHDATIDAVRSTAQLISYEIAASLAILCALLLSGSLKIRMIVDAQFERRIWFIFLAPVAFFIYFVASLLQTNRAPCELPEAVSRIVDGSQTEYHAFRRSPYLLGESVHIIVIASVATTLFLGAWLRPFPNVHWLNWLDFSPGPLLALLGVYYASKARRQPDSLHSSFMWTVALGCSAVAMLFVLTRILVPLRFALPGLNGAFWFLAKVFAYVYIVLCLRSALPRYRFGQRMHLSWRILIPLAIVNVFSVGVAMLFESQFGWNRMLALILTTAFTLAASLFLVHSHNKRVASSAAAVPSDAYVR
jgi:NADH-quinone oxidoreductase subunit H